MVNNWSLTENYSVPFLALTHVPRMFFMHVYQISPFFLGGGRESYMILTLFFNTLMTLTCSESYFLQYFGKRCFSDSESKEDQTVGRFTAVHFSSIGQRHANNLPQVTKGAAVRCQCLCRGGSLWK